MDSRSAGPARRRMWFALALMASGCGLGEDRSREAAGRAVLDLARQFIAADQRKDPAAVLALFTDSADVTIVSSGVVRPSREAWEAALRALYGGLTALAIEAESARVVALGPDGAVATVPYRYRRTDTAGVTTTGRAAITYVGARRAGQWRIVHYHFSRAPDPAP